LRFVHRGITSDVLLLVNDEIAIIIEDKTNSKDHTGQLQRYRAAVDEEFSGSPHRRRIP